jgi:hypothetical protein
LILIDRLLAGGLGFVLDKLATAVDRELDDEEHLRADLLEAQMQAELGEISDEELAAVEADILPRLREIRERRTGETSGAVSFGSGSEVEVRFEGDE